MTQDLKVRIANDFTYHAPSPASREQSLALTL